MLLVQILVLAADQRQQSQGGGSYRIELNEFHGSH